MTRLAELAKSLPPVLTLQRVCAIAECHRTTVHRSGLRPLGRRGRTWVYATEDVLRWMIGSADASAEPQTQTQTQTQPQPRTARGRGDALARLAALRGAR